MMNARRFSVLALLGCALTVCVAGCEPPMTDSEFLPIESDGGGDDASPVVDAAVSLPDGLTGTWALATDWSTCVKIGTVSWENRSRKLLRVQFSQSGFQIHETREVCSVQTTPLLGQTTIIGPAVIAGMAKISLESVLFGSGAGSSYVSGTDVQLFGIKLQNPLTEKMPTKSQTDDPRIYDSDGDGKLGATLQIGTACEVQVVQRSFSNLAGVLGSDGWITGLGMHTTEQVIMAASAPFCATPFTTEPNDIHNRFVMVRVDAGSLNLDSDGDKEVTCAEIIAGRDKLITWQKEDKTRCAK